MWIRAVLVPDGRGRVVQPDLGDKRPHRALAKRTGHGDAVAPIEHVVGAAASVELDGVHPAARPDLDGDSLKPRPHAVGSRPELAVKTPRRLHRAGNLADRHHRLTSWSDPFILQPPAWPARAGALVTSPSTAKRLRLAGRPSSQPAILARAARRRARSKSSRASCWTNPVPMLLTMAISLRPSVDPSSAFRC